MKSSFQNGIGRVLSIVAIGSGLAGSFAFEGFVSPASRVDAPAPASIGERRERRERLVERMRSSLREEERGVFLWRSGRVGGEEKFRTDPTFFYLTGHDEPGAAILLVFTRTTFEETLFLPDRDPSQEKWTGPKLGPGGIDSRSGEPDSERRAVMERTGFASVASIDTLNSRLASRSVLAGTAVLFARHDFGGLSERPTESQEFLDTVRSRFPGVRIANPAEDIARLRVVKSAAEIALIEKAVSITCEAHRQAMRQCRTARAENELQAIIEGTFLRLGAFRTAFDSIVAAGGNGTVLHYSLNRAPVKPGDLVLMDIGADYAGYAADITRTIPASGRFDRRQREIYELVLRAQREAASLLRPGATISEVHKRATAVLKEAGYDKYFPHGTSHFLGIEVHDVGNRDWPFEPGVVLTVEPGIYIPEEGLGVRIEDDYLVTPSGARKLSEDAPSSISEIERMMKPDSPPK